MSTANAIRNADLDGALAEARETYTRRRPESLARHVDASAVMPGGNTRSVQWLDLRAPMMAGSSPGGRHAVHHGGSFESGKPP